VTKDDSNPQIALLPLHPDLRAKFNDNSLDLCKKHEREALWVSQFDLYLD
jgi:hypothetical protein